MARETISDLAVAYRRRRAPEDALHAAVAEFAVRTTKVMIVPPRWPVLACSAVVVCTVLFLPVLVGQIEAPGGRSDLSSGLGGLSLSRVQIPPRPTLRIDAGGPNLASVTRLPLTAPKFSQLNRAGEQAKETL